MLPGGPFYSWQPGLTSVIDMWDLINMAPSYSLSLAAGGGRVICSALPPRVAGDGQDVGISHR